MTYKFVIYRPQNKSRNMFNKIYSKYEYIAGSVFHCNNNYNRSYSNFVIKISSSYNNHQCIKIYFSPDCSHHLEFLSISHEVLKEEKVPVHDKPNPKLTYLAGMYFLS